MADVSTNSISVPRIARNKRIYAGNTSSTKTMGGNTPLDIVSKKIIPFGSTDTPGIPDYTIYAAEYGQYPSVELYFVNEAGNRARYSAEPEILFDLGGKISSINFGTLPEAITGYISLQP